MRRRITLAILGTVAAALLLAGLGTLVLTRVGARSSARSRARGPGPGHLADRHPAAERRPATPTAPG